MYADRRDRCIATGASPRAQSSSQMFLAGVHVSWVFFFLSIGPSRLPPPNVCRLMSAASCLTFRQPFNTRGHRIQGYESYFGTKWINEEYFSCKCWRGTKLGTALARRGIRRYYIRRRKKKINCPHCSTLATKNSQNNYT